MARFPADGSENDDENANASALLAEVAALRHRLAALEERLQGNPPKEPPGRQAKPRTSRKIVARLTTGAVLAMLAGASVVYGQDAFFISKEGNVAIGPPGGLFVGKAGNVAIGTDTPSPDNKLEVKGKIAATSLNAAVDARAPVLATLDQSVKIEGSGGRNMFSDTENAGNLRVGAAWGTPGIYSEKGDVVVGSLSNNVWLAGKVAISTQGDVQKRNQPETLYVDGGIKAKGTVDGNMKVVYQRDDETQTTYEKPLWRYHMSLTARNYGGRTKTIPKEILAKLCGTRDGCEVRLGMTRWDNDSKTQTASGSYRFYYNPNDGHWRTAQGVNNGDGPEGVIGDGSTQHAVNIWNTCFFTDGTYDKYQDQGDKNTGMQLLVWNGSGNAGRTCELTLIP